jgi:hypothetical protein
MARCRSHDEMLTPTQSFKYIKPNGLSRIVQQGSKIEISNRTLLLLLRRQLRALAVIFKRLVLTRPGWRERKESRLRLASFYSQIYLKGTAGSVQLNSGWTFTTKSRRESCEKPSLSRDMKPFRNLSKTEEHAYVHSRI